MRRLVVLVVSTGFCGLLLSPPLLAATIGKVHPVHWTGSLAGTMQWHEEVEYLLPAPWVVRDSRLGVPDTVAETWYEDSHGHWVPGEEEDEWVGGSVETWSQVAPYAFRGYNAVSNFGDVHSGGFFRDEIFFETYNGAPGCLEFDFGIQFFIAVGPYAGARSRFGLNLLGYIGEDVIIDDPNDLPSDFAVLSDFWRELTVDQNGDIKLNGESYESDWLSFDDTVTISTNANGHLLASGTYVPLSFTLWTDTNNGYAEWGNTVVLEDVRVYDENHNLLDPTQYTLRSEHNDQNFPFENQMPGTVPEPATVVVWSVLGGLGLMAARRQRR